VDEFVENMYGVTDSPLMGTLPTDRFVAAWELDDAIIARQRATRAADASRLATAPMVAGGPEMALPTAWPEADAVRVCVPRDFSALLVTDPAAAAAYRRHSHAAFTHYFALRYQIRSFHPAPDGDGTYLLTRATS
jgi:predicted GNAT superfamily acetyltransferase